MIGLEVESSSVLTEFVVKVLTELDKDYSCNVFEEEIIADHRGTNGENIYFNEAIPIGDFASVLDSRDCTIIFLKLEVYKEVEAESEELDINSYEDFLKSKCDTLILISDGYFFEVYSKDIEYLDKIEKIAKEFGFSVEEKERDNDARTRMSLW